MREVCKYEKAKTPFAVTQRRLCLCLYGLCSTKEKGAFELSLKDAVAFMSANSTVVFVACQQESAIKIVFSKVQFIDRGLR